MISAEEKFKLLQFAKTGELADIQMNDATFTCWRHQGCICPSCGEGEIPWHRGILYSAGEQRVWICLVCALLAIEAYKKTPPQHLGNAEASKRIPIPDGYRIVWINPDWIFRDDKGKLPPPIRIAAGLGADAAPRILAALNEDHSVARFVRPKNRGEAADPWVPVLFKEGTNKPNSNDYLMTYAVTPEESITTKYVHITNGLDIANLTYLTIQAEPESYILPCLDGALLQSIPEMDPADRKRLIPRMGVVNIKAWHDDAKSSPSGLAKFSRWTEFWDEWVLYLISFESCGSFYGCDDFDARDPNSLWGKVGFDIGEYFDPKAACTEPIWEKIFGSDLTDRLEPEVEAEPGASQP